jgi:peptidoglycan-N-acetylglucosamine deacetylase
MHTGVAQTPRAANAPPVHLKRHPTVALTFDDLPAAGGLPDDETRVGIIGRLAGELKAGHVEGAYGFVNAVDLDDDPDAQEALRDWVSSGMNIGNHTWSHPSLTSVTAQAFEQDIAKDEPALQQYADGRDWHWFRYPNLEEGDTLAKRDDVRAWLHDHGYRIAEVTLTIQDDDWSDPYNRCLARGDAGAIAWLKQSYLANAEEFIRLGREEEQIAFGHEIPNVLLLHATDFTALMLPSLLDLLHREGFRFAPLAKVERNRAYRMDPHAGLADGGPLPNLFMNSRHLKYPPFQPEPVEKLDSLCR